MRTLALVTASASVIALGLGVASADPASAATASPACSDSYVVASTPLTDDSTGQSSWNYGYLQLWYNACNEDNYGRVVSLLSGTTEEVVFAYNTDRAYTQAYCGGGTVNVSPLLYSPAFNAGTSASVYANGVFYSGETDQKGASAAADSPDNIPCEG